MSDDKEILLDILCEILGDPEKVYDSKLQYGYNCPECGVDERKGNLEVSLEKHLFHCWAFLSCFSDVVPQLVSAKSLIAFIY